MPLRVEELGCDMLSATGRKYLRGPRGTGFLYVRQAMLERLEPVVLDMHSAQWVARDRYEIRNDAKRFESWECSLACRLGLGVAVEYAMSLGLGEIEKRVTMLSKRLRELLDDIAGVTVRDLPGSGKQSPCGIVTFTHDGHAPREIFERLREQKMNVRITAIEFTRIDMEQRGLTEMVRASLHYYNTEEELMRFAGAVRAL